jgi:hypothetical protein
MACEAFMAPLVVFEVFMAPSFDLRGIWLFMYMEGDRIRRTGNGIGISQSCQDLFDQRGI